MEQHRARHYERLTRLQPVHACNGLRKFLQPCFWDALPSRFGAACCSTACSPPHAGRRHGWNGRGKKSDAVCSILCSMRCSEAAQARPPIALHGLTDTTSAQCHHRAPQAPTPPPPTHPQSRGKKGKEKGKRKGSNAPASMLMELVQKMTSSTMYTCAHTRGTQHTAHHAEHITSPAATFKRSSCGWALPLHPHAGGGQGALRDRCMAGGRG